MAARNSDAIRSTPTCEQRTGGAPCYSLFHFFPADQHRVEILPTVYEHHDEVPGDEGEESAHRHEVPDACEMKSAEQRRHRRELDWFPEHESGEYGEHAECERLRISQLL